MAGERKRKIVGVPKRGMAYGLASQTRGDIKTAALLEGFIRSQLNVLSRTINSSKVELIFFKCSLKNKSKQKQTMHLAFFCKKLKGKIF